MLETGEDASAAAAKPDDMSNSGSGAQAPANSGIAAANISFM